MNLRALLLAVLLLPQSTKPPVVVGVFDSIQVVKQDRWTDAELQSEYDTFNKYLFNGQLKIKVDVKWKDLTDLGDMGLTVCEEGREKCSIFLDPVTHPAMKTAQMTLIHEMCHVKIPTETGKDGKVDAHGPLWQGCMLDIAKAGGLANIW